MLTRRQLIAASVALAPMLVSQPAPAAGPAAASSDPVGIVNAIYTRAVKTKNGGDFHEKSARAKYLSTEFATLWDKAEANTPEGEPGPLEFDPVSNSQDPDIKFFTTSSEKQSNDRATVAAKIAGRLGKREKAADSLIRYDFVRENGAWRIDNIRGAVDGDPWSIRDIINDSLKTQPGGR